MSSETARAWTFSEIGDRGVADQAESSVTDTPCKNEDYSRSVAVRIALRQAVFQNVAVRSIRGSLITNLPILRFPLDPPS